MFSFCRASIGPRVLAWCRVASDLPGIRVPVQTTGMGKLFRSGDVQSFAGAVTSVLENRDSLVKARDEVERSFGEQVAIEERLAILQDL
jgi:hypothetical protein